MRELVRDSARGAALSESAFERTREYLASVQNGPAAIAADLRSLRITQNS